MADKKSTAAGVQFDLCTSAFDLPDVRSRHQANRVAFNGAGMQYTVEFELTLEFLHSGKSNLHPLERRNLGNLRDWCGTATHLQCASGRIPKPARRDQTETGDDVCSHDTKTERRPRTS